MKCKECGGYNERHSPLCNNITLEDAKNQLKVYFELYQEEYNSLKKLSIKKQSIIDKSFDRLKTEISFLKNKITSLKVENNKLRNKLYEKTILD